MIKSKLLILESQVQIGEGKEDYRKEKTRDKENCGTVHNRGGNLFNTTHKEQWVVTQKTAFLDFYERFARRQSWHRAAHKSLKG